MVREAQTDLFVYELLKDAGIKGEAQGSDILEIKNALKSASKRQTGKVGFPEYIAVVQDFLLVIENKKKSSKSLKLTEQNTLDKSSSAIVDYAVNGAWFYAKHLAENTSYKKVIAIGICGDEKRHTIKPMYVDETDTYKILPEVETLINFNDKNIAEYYHTEILNLETKKEKNTKELISFAKSFHEDLRNYGKLGDKDKPLVVSGILLALKEQETKRFSIDMLSIKANEKDDADERETDGQIIYNAIELALKRSKVAPDVKRDKLLNQFSLIKDNTTLNTFEASLGESPLKYFCKQLNEHLYEDIRYTSSSEDYLGRFYGEFMSYSGGDGQSLGIILTPKHITELFCELADITSTDVVLDPCCGTGGFLIAAMHYMLGLSKTEKEKNKIRQKQLHGFEIEPYMFTIATTNMILRGDGKSNLIDTDFLKLQSATIQEKIPTIGMMNPPYSMGSKSNQELYEINFISHLLDSLAQDGLGLAIVPQSTMVGKTEFEKDVKSEILKKHTLEGVITLNPETFYGVGTLPCIAVFKAHRPHPKNKKSKFINFIDDGYKISKHIGLLPTPNSKDRKKHLLDIWFEHKKDTNDFIVEASVLSTDEWLHSFYYFDDTIPEDEEFSVVLREYITFQTQLILAEKEYLIPDDHKNYNSLIPTAIFPLSKIQWKSFKLTKIFKDGAIKRGKRLKKSDHVPGNVPYISSTANNNGIDGFIGNDKVVRRYANCLTIANSGSVGSAFYHPYEFVASDHVTHLKSENLNQYHYLFLCALLKRSSRNYNFNREITDYRISEEKLLLPVDAFDNPDWLYMESFIKNLIIDCVNKLKKELF